MLLLCVFVVLVSVPNIAIVFSAFVLCLYVVLCLSFFLHASDCYCYCPSV